MEQSFIYDDVLLSPKQQIPVHTQKEWELSYVICGQGTRFLGEERQPFREGEVILIPPQFPHGWFFDSNSTDENGCIHNITLLFASDLPARLPSVFPEFAQKAAILNTIRVPRKFVGKAAFRITHLLEDMRPLSSAERLPIFLQLLILIAQNTETEASGCRPMNKTLRNAEKFRIFLQM